MCVLTSWALGWGRRHFSPAPARRFISRQEECEEWHHHQSLQLLGQCQVFTTISQAHNDANSHFFLRFCAVFFMIKLLWFFAVVLSTNYINVYALIYCTQLQVGIMTGLVFACKRTFVISLEYSSYVVFCICILYVCVYVCKCICIHHRPLSLLNGPLYCVWCCRVTGAAKVQFKELL